MVHSVYFVKNLTFTASWCTVSTRGSERSVRLFSIISVPSQIPYSFEISAMACCLVATSSSVPPLFLSLG